MCWNFYTEEDDWNIIVTECKSLSSKWEQLSAYLGLSKNQIESIKKKRSNDGTDCLNDALYEWIGQNYITERFGMPSWRTLLKSIALINKHVFKKLAHKYEGKPIYNWVTWNMKFRYFEEVGLVWYYMQGEPLFMATGVLQTFIALVFELQQTLLPYSMALRC